MSESIYEVLILLGGGSILALLLAYIAYRFILPHWKIYQEASSYQASEWVSHTYFCGFSDGRRTDLHPKIEELVADWHGNYPSPWIFICPDSEAIFFTPRIFREYMARPSRLRPKAHTIRKAIKVKKLYQKEYKRLVAEQEAREAVKSSTTSKGSESDVA